MKRRKAIWKEYTFPHHQDYLTLQGAWGSSCKAFGEGKEMHFQPCGFVITNLSERSMKDLARHACIRLPEYVTGSDPAEEDESDEEWNLRVAEMRGRV